VKVVIPSGPRQARALLRAAIRDPDPVVFFEPARVYRAIKMEVPEEEYVIPLGLARVAREGRDLTLIAWGAQVRIALEAAERVAAEGRCDVEVIDVRTLSPFDSVTVTASVVKTGRAVVVHEAPRTGGFGAEIAAQIMERAILHLKAPVRRVTGFDTMPPLAKLEDYFHPDVDRVVDEIIATMEF